MAKQLIKLSRKMKVPVLADPKKPDPGIFAKADIITPNLTEMRLMAGEDLHGTKAVARAASSIAAAHGIGHILTTMSGEGMLLAGVMVRSPMHRLRQISFRCLRCRRYGDCRLGRRPAAGGSALDAVDIANTAAGVVVGKAGTATVTPGEVLADMVKHTVPDRAATLEQISQWRNDGETIGFTNGCFDLLTPDICTPCGCRKTCDRLVVGLNSDA